MSISKERLSSRVYQRMREKFTSLSLVQQFLLLSSISLLIFALITGWALSSYVTYAFLKREKAVTETFVRNIVADSAAKHSISVKEVLWHPEFIREIIETSKKMTEVVRVKIFDSTGTIIWSDAHQLIGKSFPLDRDIKKAISGETVVAFERLWESPEHEYEMAFEILVTVYTPIFNNDGVVEGVIELYKEPDLFLKYIRGGHYAVWGVAFIGSLVLYFFLYGIFKKASSTIIEQNINLRRANEELVAMHDALIEKERLAVIGEMASAVAHNLKNPLANIKVSAQTAAEDPSDTEFTLRTLQGIIGEVDRLDRRIREFLDFGRGDLQKKVEVVELQRLLKGVEEALQAKASGLGLQIVTEMPFEPVAVKTSRRALEYAISCLIDNAIDASRRGSKIEVSLVKQKGVASVKIRDYGDGIDNISEALKPFYTTKAKGSGLGLPIAKKFIEASGGRLEIQTWKGEGTEVLVTLPVA